MNLSIFDRAHAVGGIARVDYSPLVLSLVYTACADFPVPRHWVDTVRCGGRALESPARATTLGRKVNRR